MSPVGEARQPTNDQAPAVGLILGGGGIAGYAFHCGVLGALGVETGFEPRTAEVVVGTSAGAIAGAILRGGVTAATMRDHLLAGLDDPEELARIRLLAGRSSRAIPRLWAGPGSPSLALEQIRRGRDLRLTKLVTGLLPEGRLTLDPITGPIETLHGDDWPDRRLWIPATELRSGRRIVFGRDEHPPVARAVEASAALPGFFAPARIGSTTYVDGGVGSPFNADLLVGYRTGQASGAGRPLDLVVVAAPLSLRELKRSTPLASLARGLPRRRLQRELRRIEDEGTPVLVLDPDRDVAQAMGLNPMDHNNIDAIVAATARLLDRRLVEAPDPVRSVLDRARHLERPTPVTYPAR
jgi:NTE family protein